MMAALLSDIADRLASVSDTSFLDASVLLAHILEKPRSWVLAHPELVLTEDQQMKLNNTLTRLEKGEPFPYVLGQWEFFGMDFDISPDVLIPRPETELVVEEALALLAGLTPTPGPAAPRVADVGAGSGCLAVTIALERPNAHVLAIDISEAALRIAYENARALGAGSRIEFWRGAFLPRGVPPLDLVVANPPYVAERDRDQLPIEVRGFEPAQALFGGPDGLRVIRALVPEAAAALRPSGWLVMEIGAGQAEDVSALLQETGDFALHHIRRDLQDIPRVVVARRR
jgi:release factor glutamine methyltransferase